MNPYALAAALVVQISALAAQNEPVEIRLSPDAAATGNPEDVASMTGYLPEKDKATGAGVVVVPGGSFLIRCEDHEGTQIAKWYARHGVAAFVVHYRLAPRFTLCDELDDVRHALRAVRGRAAEFGLAPARIGVIGFSAGSYLAGEAALKPLENGRPDFLVLVYGAPGGTNDPITGFNRYFADQVGLDSWKNCTATTLEQVAKAPPTFQFVTGDDRGAARKMAEFHSLLLQQGVSSEAHFFAHGPHGVGFAQGDPVLGEWPGLMLNWLRGNNFLSPSPLSPASGIVMVDGQPLELGYVIFKPTDSKAPTRTAYIFNRTGPKGGFQLTDSQGLAAGKYHVEVLQMAKKWKSVWAEPLLLRIQSKLNSGEKLTDSEIAEWKSWAEARRYEPTQKDLTRFKTRDIEFQPGKELMIDVSR